MLALSTTISKIENKILSMESNNLKCISEKELLVFSWEIYYKCTSILKKDGEVVIDFDEKKAKELVKEFLK